MKKLSFNFLNRFERMIFKSCPESYPPISSAIALSTLAAATASLVVIFVLQMFNVDKSAASIVLGIGFGAAFLFSANRIYKAMQQITSTGVKIRLAVYSLVLFGVCALLFIYVMVWVLVVVLGGLILWLILKATLGSSDKGKRIRVHYRDGSSEEMVEDGRGICGETYYKGESGRTHME